MCHKYSSYIDKHHSVQHQWVRPYDYGGVEQWMRHSEHDSGVTANVTQLSLQNRNSECVSVNLMDVLQWRWWCHTRVLMAVA